MSVSEALLLRIGAQIDEAVTGLRQLSREVANTQEAIAAGSASAGGRVEGAFSKMVGGVGSMIGAVYTLNRAFRDMADFEQSMSKINTILGKDSAQTLAKIKKEIQGLPPALGKATQLAEAMYFALSSGVKEDKALDFVTQTAKLAKAGFADLGEVTKVTAGILNAYGDKAGTVEQITDKLFQTVKLGMAELPELAASLGNVTKIADLAGVSFNELMGGIAVLSNQGMAASEAITSYRAAIQAVIHPSIQARKFAKEMGIEFNSAALESKGVAGFLTDIRDRIGDNVEGWNMLFHSVEGFKAAAVLAADGATELRQATDAMANSAGTAEEAFERSQKSVYAQLDILAASFERLMIDVGDVLLPPLNSMLAILTTGMTEAKTPLKEVVDMFGDLATEIGKGLTELNNLSRELTGWSMSKPVQILMSTLNAMRKGGEYFAAARDGAAEAAGAGSAAWGHMMDGNYQAAAAAGGLNRVSGTKLAGWGQRATSSMLGMIPGVGTLAQVGYDAYVGAGNALGGSTVGSQTVYDQASGQYITKAEQAARGHGVRVDGAPMLTADRLLKTTLGTPAALAPGQAAAYDKLAAEQASPFTDYGDDYSGFAGFSMKPKPKPKTEAEIQEGLRRSRRGMGGAGGGMGGAGGGKGGKGGSSGFSVDGLYQVSDEQLYGDPEGAAIGGAVEGLGEKLSKAAETAEKAIDKAAGDGLAKAAERMKEEDRRFADNLNKNTADTIASATIDGFLQDGVKGAVKGFMKGFKDAMMNAVKEALMRSLSKKLLGMMGGGLGGLLGGVGGGGEHALGGMPAIGRWSLVGERGPELIRPEQSMRVHSTKETRSLLGFEGGGDAGGGGGGTGANGDVHFHGPVSIVLPQGNKIDDLRQLTRAINEAVRVGSIVLEATRVVSR